MIHAADTGYDHVYSDIQDLGTPIHFFVPMVGQAILTDAGFREGDVPDTIRRLRIAPLAGQPKTLCLDIYSRFCYLPLTWWKDLVTAVKGRYDRFIVLEPKGHPIKTVPESLGLTKDSLIVEDGALVDAAPRLTACTAFVGLVGGYRLMMAALGVPGVACWWNYWTDFPVWWTPPTPGVTVLVDKGRGGKLSFTVEEVLSALPH